MRISWSDRSIADLTEIRDYIAKDSPSNAASFMAKIVDSVETLTDLPRRGRRVPEYPEVDDLREILVGGYRILHLTRQEEVNVVTVLHGSRDLLLIRLPELE